MFLPHIARVCPVTVLLLCESSAKSNAVNMVDHTGKEESKEVQYMPSERNPLGASHVGDKQRSRARKRVN